MAQTICAITIGAPKDKANGATRTISLIPMAHQWRNGALTAK
jgi:hypothetical protein